MAYQCACSTAAPFKPLLPAQHSAEGLGLGAPALVIGGGPSGGNFFKFCSLEPGECLGHGTPDLKGICQLYHVADGSGTQRLPYVSERYEVSEKTQYR